MKREFNSIIDNLKTTIVDYKYYTNFQKVYDNVLKFKVELNILNSLIGSKNIADDFRNIVEKYPDVLKVIPSLLAIRQQEIPVFTKGKLINYNFKNKIFNIEDYVTFMDNTGLFELLSENKIKNLFDYITGVEVGLDSNARKNRSGQLMQNIVWNFIQNIKKIKEIDCYSEMKTTTINSKYNIDLRTTDIKNNKKAEKKFDFVIKTKTELYVFEVNFYCSQGSKLNETARSYKDIALSTNKIKNVHFIWITDGKGWLAAKNNLKETYDIMEHFYTLYDLEKNILDEVIK